MFSRADVLRGNQYNCSSLLFSEVTAKGFNAISGRRGLLSSSVTTMSLAFGSQSGLILRINKAMDMIFVSDCLIDDHFTRIRLKKQQQGDVDCRVGVDT